MKTILILGTLFFIYTMFMIHQTAKFFHTKAKKSGAIGRIIDSLEAHWNLYCIKHKIEFERIQAKNKIEFVEVEEVPEDERPKSATKLTWTVENYKRLGESFADTKLID